MVCMLSSQKVKVNYYKLSVRLEQLRHGEVETIDVISGQGSQLRFHSLGGSINADSNADRPSPHTVR